MLLQFDRDYYTLVRNYYSDVFREIILIEIIIRWFGIIISVIQENNLLIGIIMRWFRIIIPVIQENNILIGIIIRWFGIIIAV